MSCAFSSHGHVLENNDNKQSQNELRIIINEKRQKEVDTDALIFKTLFS